MAEVIDIVTGGAGFIGSHLTRTLLEQGSRVRVIDDFSTGKRENLVDCTERYGDRLEIHELDIASADGLAAVFQGARHVYHQAAMPSVQRSVEDPARSLLVNTNGTLNVLMAAKAGGAEKVVYASSSSVYGDTDVLPKHESMMQLPRSPYAVAKCAAEMLGKMFPGVYGLPTVGLRYFNVFGPWQDPLSQYAAVIPRFITNMLAGKPPVIYGDGEQTRDFTYIDNVVHANLTAARSSASGISVNIGCGGRYSLNDLASRLNEILGTSLAPKYEAMRVGDVKDSEADIGEACREIGYEPAIDFAEGLRRTVEWFRGGATGDVATKGRAAATTR